MKKVKDKKKSEDMMGKKSGNGEKTIQEEKKKEHGLEVLEKDVQSEGSKKEVEGKLSEFDGKELSGSKKDSVSDWATVTLAKVGRSSPEHVSEVLISASKFSVLSVSLEEVEEGEIAIDVQENDDEEKLEVGELYEEFEGDSLEDDILLQ